VDRYLGRSGTGVRGWGERLGSDRRSSVR